MISDNTQKRCGFCGENIPAGAGRCPYCGSILEVKIESHDPFTRQVAGEQGPMDGIKPEDTMQPESHRVQETPDPNGQPQNTRDTGYRPAPGQSTGYVSRIQGVEYNKGGYETQNRYTNPNPNPLSNGMKVLLTVLFTLIPGIGQLAGIITAIIFMNTEGDSDRKSFGVALLVASIVMFVFACIGCFILVIALSSSSPDMFMY